MRMNIARLILEQEDAERAAAAERAVREQRTTVTESRTAAQLAQVEREIAVIKAYLDPLDDDPSLWPLRKKLVGLWREHKALLDQLEGGTHR